MDDKEIIVQVATYLADIKRRCFPEGLPPNVEQVVDAIALDAFQAGALWADGAGKRSPIIMPKSKEIVNYA